MRIALTALAAALLAAVASGGVYIASQPTATQVHTPLVNYGARP